MHRVRFRSALASGVALALSPFSPPSFAQAASAQPEVVVTANRTPVTVDATLASVSVITRDDIEAGATNDLLDLLRAVPGLDIVRGGGFWQQTSVFLRGTRPRNRRHQHENPLPGCGWPA